MKYFLCILFTFFTFSTAWSQNNADAIIGKWMSYPKKDLIVEVFKDHNQYKGKITWFSDHEDKTRPMNSRLDEKNPNRDLRSRKWIGLEVLYNLNYNSKANRWEGGKIYDAKTGKTWNAYARVTKDGVMEVKAFWRFEFVGQNLVFKRS